MWIRHRALESAQMHVSTVRQAHRYKLSRLSQAAHKTFGAVSAPLETHAAAVAHSLRARRAASFSPFLPTAVTTHAPRVRSNNEALQPASELSCLTPPSHLVRAALFNNYPPSSHFSIISYNNKALTTLTNKYLWVYQTQFKKKHKNSLRKQKKINTKNAHDTNTRQKTEQKKKKNNQSPLTAPTTSRCSPVSFHVLTPSPCWRMMPAPNRHPPACPDLPVHLHQLQSCPPRLKSPPT